MSCRIAQVPAYLGGYLFWRNHLYTKITQISNDPLLSHPSFIPHGLKKGHLLAHKVIHHAKGTNSTRPQSNHLPRQLALDMLAISTKAQARTDKSSHHSVGNKDRVIRVGSQTTALSLAGLGLLRRLLLHTLGLFLLGLTLETLSLSGGLDFLVEEIRVNGLDVGRVDVDQGGRALGFIFVDTADGGGTTDVGEEELVYGGR